MLDNLSYSTTLNRRERYSKITLKYWEVEDHLNELEYLFWLEDVVTFSVKGEEVVIPITAPTSGDSEERVDFIYLTNLHYNIISANFPIKGKESPQDMVGRDFRGGDSRFQIWGEDDNIVILPSEFSAAGGDYSIVFNTEENQWEFRLTPPTSNIGTNSDFSITLEGSVPALVISGLGYKYVKREIVAYTEHFGIVDNDLEIDLEHIADRGQALNVMQRLIQKYNTLQPTYDYAYLSVRDDEYLTKPPPVIDNNHIIPQTVSVDLQGEHAIRSATGGVAHNDLGTLIQPWDIPDRSLSEISQPSRTLDEIQYNIRTFIY